MAEDFGYHSLLCNKSSEIYFRQSCLNYLSKRAVLIVTIPFIIELTTGVVSDSDKSKRVDEIISILWKRGSHLVWDAACVVPICPLYLIMSLQKKYKQLKE